jgi:DNA-binding response OmpR family regulator
MATRILIIEDEAKIARFIELELVHEGYEAQKAFDGRSGLELAEGGNFDLVILDIMLPELNGLEVLRRLRKSSQVPVILLTARDAVMDKVSGLDLGANDYITKPFAIEELLARIRVLMRYGSQQKTEPLSCGGLTLNVSSHEASCDGAPLQLTNKEFTLLQTLLENKNIVMSRDSLLERVWGYDYMGETNVVDVYVRYLRQKGINVIQTVRGVGYIIKDERQ